MACSSSGASASRCWAAARPRLISAKNTSSSGGQALHAAIAALRSLPLPEARRIWKWSAEVRSSKAARSDGVCIDQAAAPGRRRQQTWRCRRAAARLRAASPTSPRRGAPSRARSARRPASRLSRRSRGWRPWTIVRSRVPRTPCLIGCQLVPISPSAVLTRPFSSGPRRSARPRWACGRCASRSGWAWNRPFSMNQRLVR